MAKDKEIRNRIKTVKNIAKVTKTMQMISASRMKKSIKLWQESFPYSQEISGLVSKIGGLEGFESPLTKSSKEIKKVAIVAVAPTKGFVGSLVAKQLGEIYRGIQEIKLKYPAAEVSLVSIHKLGIKLASSLGVKNDLHFAKEIVKPGPSNMSAIYKAVKDRFFDGQYNLVYLCYTKFESATRQGVIFEPLLPINFMVDTKKQATSLENTAMEPNQRELLTYLLNEYFEKQLIGAILSSNASEHSARMISMKNATDNALGMSQDLTLRYNKSRQAQITQQVVEVSAGGAL
ncbi:MAG: ATP synthase F1 subunit gamma [Patescibacteria group bacterium]